MNERNQELIVDLLGGLMSPDEERRALARIENDPGLRAEYKAQISALSILSSSATPMMTTDERTALHSSLRSQLHLEDAPVAVVAAPSRWQRWWAPIGGLAIAAAVFVGAVVVLPGALSENDSDGTFEMAAADITTTAASSSQADDLAPVVGDEGAGDNSAGAAAPEATESALEEESSADAETQSVDTYEAAPAAPALPYLTDVDLGSLENDLASDPGSLRRDPPPSSSKSTDFGTEAVDTCLESLRVLDPSSEIFPVALTTYDDTASVVVSVSPSSGDGFLAVYSVALCVQLASTQG